MLLCHPHLLLVFRFYISIKFYIKYYNIVSSLLSDYTYTKYKFRWRLYAASDSCIQLSDENRTLKQLVIKHWNYFSLHINFSWDISNRDIFHSILNCCVFNLLQLMWVSIKLMRFARYLKSWETSDVGIGFI